ncbi:MAG: NAD(P)/FAD-dependent oxidoreductase [Gammaproteobacteria bacterium]|nr:NAD(P)/FAD-dependent oxidoreductase [Gammaproteobacteria bacterium]
MTKDDNDIKVDAIIVGAGFSGLYMLYKLKELGLTAKVIEAGKGVGGTWYWNRYPGARCDVESMEYSYSFCEDLQQDWVWTERFAGQEEILRYLEHVADRFELRADINLETKALNCEFSETTNLWSVQTTKDNYLAKYCIMATGPLSSTNVPDFPGLRDYKGKTYHTGSWPHDKVDFSGKTVGIIGTGSSGIQSTPIVAQQAKHLFVFQRTPNFSVPAGNTPLSDQDQNSLKSNYSAFRKQQRGLPAACNSLPRRQGALEADDVERNEVYEDYWKKGGLSFLTCFNDLVSNKKSNETAVNFIRNKIEEIVEDPETAKQLSPDHLFGCKRPCSDTGYYEAFNQKNVSLIDVLASPIISFTRNGIETADRHFELDNVIFATGFDAMTGSLDRINIKGRNGQSLKSKWQAGPVSYLGLSVSGFPNLFIMTGPGSPSVLANMVVGSEQHGEWISECIQHIEDNNLMTIEASETAEINWVEHINNIADTTIYPTCNSWYLGANIPGKPRIFMPYVGGFQRYERKCKAVQAENYAGYHFS